jgi:molybdate transport system substrate-binding protein
VTRVAIRSAGLLLVALPSATGRAETLRVFAAASLADVLAEISEAFEAARPGTKVELSLAGSQVLATQIAEGAPADIFASADVEHVEALQDEDLLEDVSVFARNSLAVVTPLHDARVRELADLLRPGIKIVVAGPNVPAGRYTSRVLRRMTASGLYGDDCEALVRKNVVSHEANVRAVLAKVELGEADAGFVYATDAAAAAGRVNVLTVPEGVNVIAEYPVGVVARSPRPALARAFVAAVLSPEGRTILREHGFTVDP